MRLNSPSEAFKVKEQETSSTAYMIPAGCVDLVWSPLSLSDFCGHGRNMQHRQLTLAVRTESMYFPSPTSRCQ